MNTVSFGARSLVMVAGLLLLLPVTTSAQQQRERRRVVAPRIQVIGPDAPHITMQSFRFPRARIGVALGGEEQRDYPDGAYIQDVTEDGPAEMAGLREGDVIVAVDGHRLAEPLDAEDEEELDEDASLAVQRLMALAREWEPGDDVAITYVRDGQENTVTMEAEESEFHGRMALRMEELGDRLSEMGPRLYERLGPLERLWELEGPEAPRVWIGEGEGPGAFAFGFGSVGGLELRTLNPDLGRYFGTDEGVLVLEVDEESTLGLEAGDVILGIGDRDVDDSSDVRRILRSYDEGEVVRFRVMRDGQSTTAEGTVRD